MTTSLANFISSLVAGALVVAGYWWCFNFY